MKMMIIITGFLLSSISLMAQQSKTKYTVYYFLGEDCKICQYYSPLMNQLDETFSSDSLSFVGLFPNRYSTEQGISDFKEKHKLNFELKREYFGTKTKRFGVTITPEVVVYNEVEQKVLYKGRIDNSYFKIGRQRRVVTSSELEDVLTSISKGASITTQTEPAIGCYITFR